MQKQSELFNRRMQYIQIIAFLISCTLYLGAYASSETREVSQQFNGLTVNGRLVLANGNTIPERMILIAHSLIQHNGREPIPYVQEVLSEHGYSSLAINYSLEIDNRHGSFDCMSPHRYTLERSLEEIGVWIKWLKDKGAGQLVLLGHSYGGNEVARYAANNDEEAIKGIILLGPGTADHRMWSPGGYKIRYGKDITSILERAELLIASGKEDELMEGVDFIFCPKAMVSAASFVSYYRVAPERLLPNLMKAAKKPTLFIAAGEDNRMSDLNRLVKPFVNGERTRLVVVDGAGHFFLDLHSDDAVDQMIKFFKDIEY